MRADKKRKTHVVIAQDWMEYERGWGSRPDGCSLHLSEMDRKMFISAYWARMPDLAPDEYSKETGTPYLVVVTNELYLRLVASIGKFGVYSEGVGRDVGVVRRASLDELVS